MSAPQFFKRLFGLFILSGLIFLALKFNAPTWQKAGLFLIYWYIAGAGWRRVLVTRFDFSPSALRVRLLGALGALAVSGWMIGAGLYFYRFTPIVAALGLFVAAFLPLVFWAKESEKAEFLVWFKESFKVAEELPRSYVGVFLYAVLWFICARQLFAVIPTEVGISGPLVTPWQILPQYYIYWFLSATTVLGFLCFAKLPAKAVLFLLMAHSFLLTAYLPATHEYFYNGDQWRHLGQELNLATGNSFITVIPNTVIPTEVGISGQSVAISFWQKLDIGRFGYAQFWSLGIIANKFFNFDLMDFNRWFGPILWSIFFPILAFEWGRALRFQKSESLFLVWLGFLPFGLQIAGATTLPVNTDFLIWLFLMLMVVKRPAGEKHGLVFLAILGTLLIFGYTLYFILFWLGWGAYFVIARREATKQSQSYLHRDYFATLVMTVLILTIALSIPTIELATNYSQFNHNINWLGQAQQAVGNFTAYFLASGPRPHDIASGNILFNQVPSYAYVANILTQWRWWLVGFSILFWLAAVAGSFLSFRRKSESLSVGNFRQKFLAILFLGLISANIISRYFLTGDNLLARRLDVILAWLAVVMVVVAIRRFVIPSESAVADESRNPLKRILLPVIIFVVSLATATSYSIGPDAKTVSADEYQSMDYIYSVIASEEKQSPPCVLADTYPLLALEAISAKKIIGGGFPMGQNFSQTERVQLFNGLKISDSEKVFKEAKLLTGADTCYGVVKTEEIRYNIKDFEKQFGEVLILKN